MIHKSHKLYIEADFTEEEVKRRNLLAVAVLEEGLLRCKNCWCIGPELDNSCEYNKQARRWRREGY